MAYSKFTQYWSRWNHRLLLDNKERWRLNDGILGDQGEMKLNQLMKPILPKDWIWLTNLWIHTEAGNTQIDSMIVAPTFVHIFEVKNLQAKYKYENGNWIKHGRKNNRNFFTQGIRQHEIMSAGLNDISCHLDLLQKIVLINDDDNVEFIDKTYFHLILDRWEIYRYIKKLEKTPPPANRPWDVDRLAERILSLSVEEPNPKPIQLVNRPITLGILCAKCHRPKLHKERYHYACKHCLYKESKMKSLARTICEFSLLFPEKATSHQEIMWFLNDSSLADSLRYVLNNHFPIKSRSKSIEYQLPGKLYQYAFNDLKFYYNDSERLPIDSFL